MIIPTCITIQNLTIKRGHQLLINKLNLQLSISESLAIIGPSGSGKTSLIMAMQNLMHYNGTIEFSNLTNGQKPHIAFVPQVHMLKNKSNTTDIYYQQRYHAYDAQDAITAYEYLNNTNPMWIEAFGMQTVLQEPLVQLSNGEHKKLQLIKAFNSQPNILLLDQPFTGLDPEARTTLNQILLQLKAQGCTIVLTASPNQIPICCTHVLSIASQGNWQIAPNNNGNNNEVQVQKTPAIYNEQLLAQLIEQPLNYSFTNAIQMVDCSVQYDDKLVLNQINWTVKKGERILMHGPNGSGKSTLMSIITADHPQAYANQVFLFDKRRGTGETIWDIKRKIGFVSPELQQYFNYEATGFETVASGLFDTIGLFTKLNENQKTTVNKWLTAFNLQGIAHKPLKLLSISEQRLLLLARALLKNPPLLILDEPCQGLDDQQATAFLNLIDTIANKLPITLIYITHYWGQKPNCITSTVTIDNGKLMEQ